MASNMDNTVCNVINSSSAQSTYLDPTAFRAAFGPFVASIAAHVPAVTTPLTSPVSYPKAGSQVDARVGGQVPLSRPPAPDGYYYNNRGSLKKHNPPTSRRKEFGMLQTLIAEAELNYLRPSTINQRQSVFAKDPFRSNARIWLSIGEREELNKYRQAHGGKRVNTSERILKDLNFQKKAPQAERRHKLVEHMKSKGQSTRTKEALRDLDHTG